MIYFDRFNIKKSLKKGSKRIVFSKSFLIDLTIKYYHFNQNFL